jgi:hypothetical protein
MWESASAQWFLNQVFSADKSADIYNKQLTADHYQSQAENLIKKNQEASLQKSKRPTHGREREGVKDLCVFLVSSSLT